MLPVTSSSVVNSGYRIPTYNQAPTTGNIFDISKNIIQNLSKLPGIAPGATFDEIEAHRLALLGHMSELQSVGRLKSQGDDSVIRPVVVGLQAVVEHTLLQQLKARQIDTVSMTFTTKRPPTPLCSEGTVPDNLATAEVLNSSGCIDTIISRQNLLRMLIAHPEVSMWSYYDQKQDENEQRCFDNFCTQNSRNFHHQQVEKVPDDMSGATYQIIMRDGSEHWFGIRFTQANQSASECTLFTNTDPGGEKSQLLSWVAEQQAKQPMV